MSSINAPVTRTKNFKHIHENGDTIAAIATPSGRGGIGVIRISGSLVSSIAIALLGKLPQPRSADYLVFRAEDGSVIDEGLAIYFVAPHSFTGEEVLELQGHGGPVILDCVLQRVLQLGARLAKPGEFSERAFLNGKLDLLQAEAVADLIEADTRQAASAAIRTLQGDFSKFINATVEKLTHLRSYLEAAIDFSDESIDFLKDSDLENKINLILVEINKIMRKAQQGTLLKEGLQVALIGPPNAGKSSLLNALSGQESAIVTPIAGTTRDVVREKIHIDGLPLHIVDTAGLRETEDEIEREGIKRSWAQIEKSDLIIYVIDSTAFPRHDIEKKLKTLDFFNQFTDEKKPVILVRNKIDISQESPCLQQLDNIDVISMSVKTTEGLSLLKAHLKSKAGYEQGAEDNFSVRRRHLEALEGAEYALIQAQQKLLTGQFLELIAEDLTRARKFLGEITGAFTTEDLLSRIFSSFCIGK